MLEEFHPHVGIGERSDGRIKRSPAFERPLRKQLLDNEAYASKANPYDPRRKLIHANEYKASPDELIRL